MSSILILGSLQLQLTGRSISLKLELMTNLVGSLELVVRRSIQTFCKLKSTNYKLPTTHFSIGFTLLEVLFTISFIGIVSTISYRVGNDYLERRHDARRIADIDLLKTSIEQFYEKNNKYPPLAGLGTAATYTSSSGGTWIPELGADYLRQQPKDPLQAGTGFLARVIDAGRDTLARLLKDGPIENVYAAYSGPNGAALGSNVACSGTGNWSISPTTALQVADNARATVSLSSGASSNCLHATSFGFAIDPAAVIDGISVGIQRNSASASTIIDNTIQLLDAGTPVGTNLSTGATWFNLEGSCPSCPNFGGPTNLWGQAPGWWTPAKINSSTFGMRLKVTALAAGGTARVNLVRIYVYYTIPTPTVTTQAADPPTQTTATLNGQANPNGSATTGWFRYSTTNPGTCNDTFGTRAPASGGASLGSGSSAVPYSENISSLTAGTTYHFCAIASNSGGTVLGSVLSFTTSTAPPTVTTQAADPPTQTTATLNGQANPNGQASTGWFRFSAVNGSCSTLANVTSPSTVLGGGSSAVPYSHNISGLTIGTTYYFCAVAQNPTDTTYGNVLLFTTLSAPVPVVTLTANGSDGPITVSSGSQVTIAWTATNSPTSCDKQGAWNEPPSANPAGGSLDVTVTANGTYTLACDNADGSGQDSVVVNLIGSGGVYVYWVAANRLSFQIWAVLENDKDPRIYTHPDAKCKDTPPPEVLAVGPYNFCGSF